MRTGIVRLRLASNQLTSLIPAAYRVAAGVLSNSAGEAAIAAREVYVNNAAAANTTEQAACGFARGAKKQTLFHRLSKPAFFLFIVAARTNAELMSSRARADAKISSLIDTLLT
jgi:hypothetical protein